MSRQFIIVIITHLFIQNLTAQVGMLDVSFGYNGIIATSIGNAKDFATGVIIQPDGKIVAAGSARFGKYNDIALVRYNSTGMPDSTFGTNGIVKTNIGITNEDASAILITPDDKFIVNGETHNGSDYDFAVVKYQMNGQIDSTFGTNGIVVTPIGSGHDYSLGSALQSDGKIIVVGFTDNGTDNDIVLVRYNTDGTLDTDFDGDGIVITAIGTSNDRANGVALQDDGRIIITGNSTSTTDDDIAIVRYNTDGSLDPTFGNNGIVLKDVNSNSEDICYSVLVNDDKIFVAGESSDSMNYDFTLLKLNDDGTFAEDFGTNGMVTTPIGSANDNGHSMLIQIDGKIVVAGFTNDGVDDDFALIRYNSDGSLDTGFGQNGVLVIPLSIYDDKSNHIAQQPDGKLILVGGSFNGSNNDFAVIRIE